MERSISKLKKSAPSKSPQSKSFYDRFVEYLLGIAGGNKSLLSATSIANDVVKFLSQSAGSSTTTDTELLLSRKALETYFVHLKSAQGYQPTTIAEKLRRMEKAIEFIIHEADNTPEGDALYIRGRKLLDTLKGWGHSLGKSIAIQRQQYLAKVADELPLIEEPDSFLDDKEVSEKLEMCHPAAGKWNEQKQCTPPYSILCCHDSILQWTAFWSN